MDTCTYRENYNIVGYSGYTLKMKHCASLDSSEKGTPHKKHTPDSMRDTRGEHGSK
jgi:hypothetical protein